MHTLVHLGNWYANDGIMGLQGEGTVLTFRKEVDGEVLVPRQH